MPYRREGKSKSEVKTEIALIGGEAGDKPRVTITSLGFVKTNLADSITNTEVKAQIVAGMDRMAISPDAVARAIAFAIEEPADVDVGEVVIRPTAQG